MAKFNQVAQSVKKRSAVREILNLFLNIRFRDNITSMEQEISPDLQPLSSEQRPSIWAEIPRDE